MLQTILTEIVPLAVPVVASALFYGLNKGTVLLDALPKWGKRLAVVLVTALVGVGLTALGVTVPAEAIVEWDQATVEGVVQGVAAVLLYDLGKTGGRS